MLSKRQTKIYLTQTPTFENQIMIFKNQTPILIKINSYF